MLKRLLEKGYIDDKEVESTIHGRMQHKKQKITDSLFGTINEHQLFLIRQSWKHIEYLESLTDEIDKKVDQILLTYQEELAILTSIPGISKNTASVIIAEIGVDMTQFPSS